MFGNINAITRTNDFRNLFKDNLSKEAIDNILVNASIRSYVSQFKAINKLNY